MITSKKANLRATPVPQQMKKLYKRLSEKGFSRSYILKYVLPKTWRDDLATNDASYQVLLTFLSENLGIDLDSLQDTDGPITFGDSHARLFRGRDFFEEPDATQQVAQGIARVFISGLNTLEVLQTMPIQAPPALVLRREILQAGKPWVGFRDLLLYCWRIGVPVLHVRHLPAKSQKHKGIALEVGKLPAIVLCQKQPIPSWHLKVLAHEIGHLTKDDADLLKKPATTEEQTRLAEQSERAAEQYATSLITGSYTFSRDVQPYARIQDLVEATYTHAHKEKIDPSYLIIRRGGITKNWQEAQIALKMINEREGGASLNDLVNSEILARIKKDKIGYQALSFFQRVTDVPLQMPAILPIWTTLNSSTVAYPVVPSISNDIEAVTAIVGRLLKPEAIDRWFDKELPALDNQKPIDVIRSGRADSVIELLLQVEAGIYI